MHADASELHTGLAAVLECQWTLKITQMITSSFLFVALPCKSCPEGIDNEGNSLGPSIVAHHAHPPCLTCRGAKTCRHTAQAKAEAPLPANHAMLIQFHQRPGGPT